MHPISVVFTLPEENLPDIEKHAAANLLTVIALSRDLKTELDRGTVAVVDNQILQTTGMLRLKATFPHEGQTLWPGDFVNARPLTATTADTSGSGTITGGGTSTGGSTSIGVAAAGAATAGGAALDWASLGDAAESVGWAEVLPTVTRAPRSTTLDVTSQRLWKFM